jgi:hypothetical protein
MKITIVKKATVNTKPAAYCDFVVDDPPPMAKKN